jgi:DNA polymerase-3 subunit alpha
VQLEGLTRNVGKHAGGVVIAPSRLTDFSPLYCDSEGGSLVTQYDKNDVEDVGLVKFDFLGLRTLTIIDWAQRIINRNLRGTGRGGHWISSVSPWTTRRPSSCCAPPRQLPCSSSSRGACAS